MTTVKRSVLALVLLFMISMPLTLLLCFKVQQIVVRGKMEKKLEHSLLQTIRLPANEVHWYKKNKEIVVAGSLFDVKTYYPVAGTDSIEFTGLYDHEETGILNRITRMAKQSKGNNPVEKLIMQAMCLLLYPVQHYTGLNYTCFIEDSNFAPYKIAGLPLTYPSVPAPPPKS